MNSTREYGRILVVLLAFGAGWMGATVLFDFAVTEIDPAQRSSSAAYQVMRAPKLLEGAEVLLLLAAAGVFLLPAALAASVSQPGLTRKWMLFPMGALVFKTGQDLWPSRFRLPFAVEQNPLPSMSAATAVIVALLIAGTMLGLMAAVFVERLRIGRGLSAASRQDQVFKRQRDKQSSG